MKFTLFKKNKSAIATPQQGRSMVEMLGTLAIIGVLSVGGIAGYRVAMNRYQANEILDIVSKAKVIQKTMEATHDCKIERNGWSAEGCFVGTSCNIYLVEGCPDDLSKALPTSVVSIFVYMGGKEGVVLSGTEIGIKKENKGIIDALESITGEKPRIYDESTYLNAVWD
jgi:hypothetical protein